MRDQQNRFPAIVLTVVLIVPCSIRTTCSADDTIPFLITLIETARERRLEAEAMAEAARIKLQQQRLKLIAQELENSRKEKQKIGEEQKRLELEVSTLRHRNDMRDWVLGRFEAADRDRIPKTDAFNRRFAQWETARQQYRDLFLRFPEQSRGAVASGRALNFFLDSCGGVAADIRLTDEKLKDTLAVLRHEHPMAEGPDRERIEALMRDIETRRDVLFRVGGKEFITPYIRDRLIFQRGLTGPKLTISSHPEDGALPLNWPPLLKNNPKYDHYLREMETAKYEALNELRGGMPVSSAVQSRMLSAADEIYLQFEHEIKDFHQAFDKYNKFDFDQFRRTKQFVHNLRAGVSRFVHAREIADVEPSKFEGKTIEDLLVYMMEQGLTFGQADANSEPAYKLVYEQLVDFYVNLHGLRRATLETDNEVAQLDQRIDKLIDMQRPTTVDDLERLLKADPFDPTRPAAGIDWPSLIHDIGKIADFGAEIVRLRRS